MRQTKVFFLSLLLIPSLLVAQPPSGGDPATVNKLPDYILPSPEAASLFKAEELSVNYATGSPNISIPLGNLTVQSFNLAITLSYNSTGIKVDEYASMVGMGWNIQYGGIISRTILGKPDESRSSTNNNLKAPSFLTYNAALLDFLKNAPDRESDIFNLSLPGINAKFILDTLNNPVFLTNVNCKIAVLSSNFLNGFVVTTDNGTAYYFDVAEVSEDRNPTGENCEKNYDATDAKTSWYLSRIELPNTRKKIFFTYDSTNVISEQAISQTVNRVVWSEQYNCAGSPSGYACPVNSERYSTCIPVQTIKTRLISRIETSDGDKVYFNYVGSREDLEGGKRLDYIRIINRYDRLIRRVDFYTVFKTSVNSSTSYRMKRLFLDSVVVSNTAGSVVKKMKYDLKYNDYGGLPARLTYGQDFYGYYNGKNSNASLIPTLGASDINYSTFNNGTAATSVAFGDRSIDTVYAKKGLLCKIIYPTGGFDTLMYAANRKDTNTLAGGNSVYKIISYTGAGLKALERTFVYKYKDSLYGGNTVYSGVAINDNLKYSQRNMVRKDFYICGGIQMCQGLRCEYAVVTSNAVIPLMALGTQHFYHRSVMVFQNNTSSGSATNGMTEHKYLLHTMNDPYHLMNNVVMNCPYQVFTDIVFGETETNIYKSNGSSYDLLKKKTTHFLQAGFTWTSNYLVKKNYEYGCVGNPPAYDEFDPYDVDGYLINKITILPDTVVETDYSDPSKPIVTTQIFSYNFPAYTYPNQITVNQSDGSTQKITRKYPPDGSYSFMTNRNIISPVVEERNYRNTSLLSSMVNTFVDYFSNTKNIVLQSTEFKRDSSIQINKFLFNSYDTLNNVLELQQIYDQRMSYIWDYNYSYPIAKITNALTTQTAYTSFEADGQGNWLFAGSIVYDSTAPTGRKVYNLTANQIVRFNLTSTKFYIVSYWSKNGSYSVSNGSLQVTGKTINGWTYYQHTVTGASSTTISGSGYIDELRLYPVEAQMITYTYEPMIGMTSQCDVSNVITYFEYDVLGRLNLVRDQDKNVVKKFCYNYAGQAEECESRVFYNFSLSQSFTRNNCSSGYYGSSVTYSVPANKYSSALSQADANQQAQNDITTNGQTYANNNGTCTIICAPGNCTGVNKKCVGNVCETGTKVYTSSVQVHGSLWECTYHWHWSDGTNSGDYTESSPTPCFGGDD